MLNHFKENFVYTIENRSFCDVLKYMIIEHFHIKYYSFMQIFSGQTVEWWWYWPLAAIAVVKSKFTVKFLLTNSKYYVMH